MQKALEDRSDRRTHGKRLQFISIWFTLISERASGILLQPRGPRGAATRDRRCGEDEVKKRGEVGQGNSRWSAPPPFVSSSIWGRNYSPPNFSSYSVLERTPRRYQRRSCKSFKIWKSRSRSKSIIFAMTPIYKCHLLQFCVSSHRFRDIDIWNIWPWKSRSRSRSKTFAM